VASATVFFVQGRTYAAEHRDVRERRYVQDGRYAAGAWMRRSGVALKLPLARKPKTAIL